ncbi:tyrosine-type recombinase/integrase [Terasakiella pusilla]|uniref:tyrosine-type recombinase/integrase n=1 Tax=Terasakiella pusilla TaxID=64973 RepID=UPI003AA9572E
MPKQNRGPHLKFFPKKGAKGTWFIQWFEHGRRRTKSTRTECRADAEKALAEFIIGQEPVGPRDPVQRQITDVLTAYATEKAIHAKDSERIAYTIEALVPFWAGLTVSDVKESTCRKYAKERGLSDGTIRRELATLRAAINYDFQQGNLTQSVFVWMPPKPEHKDRWLTRREAAKLLHHSRCFYYKSHPSKDGLWQTRPGRLYLPLFILLAIYTGQRKEAILSLRWPQIDLERGLIDFNPAGRKRTKKGRPIIKIPRRLMTFLKLARQRGTDTGYVVNNQGKPIKDIKKSFKNAAVDAGFIVEEHINDKGEKVYKTDVTPHVLRHTCASWLVQKGVSFAKVAAYLGHDDSRTTEKIYAHHAPDYHDDAIAAFD